MTRPPVRVRLRHSLRGAPGITQLVRYKRLLTGHINWRKYGRSTVHPDGAGAGKRVLFATGGGGYLGGARVEGMLAAAVRIRGAEPHMLLCDGMQPACFESTIAWDADERGFARRGPPRLHCQTCFTPAARSYGTLGVPVHRYGQYLTANDIADANRTARDIRSEDIASFTLDGLPLGEHALAGTLRFYARATLADPHADVILRRYLAGSLVAARATQRLLDKVAFDCAVLHHGIYVPQGVMAAVLRSRGVPITTWHTAYRSRTFIFSHDDSYHHTLMAEPTDVWDGIEWTPALERFTLEYLRSRWVGSNDWIKFHRSPDFDVDEWAKSSGLDWGKPVVGALTNVLWDAQLHYPANAFPNMLDWLLHTVRCFAARPDLQLVIRVHPAELTGGLPSRQRVVDELAAAFPTLPSNVFVVPPENRISTYALMERCDAAIIYGTKTGVELAAQGIPVIVAGEAWIRNKGITQDARTRVEYDEILSRLPFRRRMADQEITRARKYAFHFFFRRMIELEFMEPRQDTRFFDVGVDSLEELAPGNSAGLDVICDGILRGRPYVFPFEDVLTGRESMSTPSAAAVT